jgi:hypothetical protein
MNNLQAVDRVRHHGYGADQRTHAKLCSLEAMAGVRMEKAPQRFGDIDSAPENGMGPEGPDTQHLVEGRDGAFASRLAAPAQNPLTPSRASRGTPSPTRPAFPGGRARPPARPARRPW